MKNSLTQATEPDKPIALRVSAHHPSLGLLMASALGAVALMALAQWLLGLGAAEPNVLLATSAFALSAVACAYAMYRTYPHDRIGLCNFATLARLVIVGVLFVAMLEPVPTSMGLLVLAIVALCLDGVDGWLARREKLVSRFGARFDVEVDAAFALLLAVHAVRTDVAGLYVLVLGLPYYLFWIARMLWPWLNAPLPERLSRKAICVLQIATLVALLVPQFVGVPLDALVAIAAVALAWSFGRDILWLHRSRV